MQDIIKKEEVKLPSNFTGIVNSNAYQKIVKGSLDKDQAQRFVGDMLAIVNSNYALQKCDAESLLSAGLVAQRLNLPLTQSLGFAYVVPYGSKAQFQIGWKGLIQLAIRTGQYQSIGCDVVREGEYLGRDELTGEPKFKFKDNDTGEIIGYYAYFKMVNGFTKVIYWSKERCQEHAKKYSKSYGNGTATDNWTQMFDIMALKTTLKQLISKWGIMSVELQKAVQLDQAVIDADEKPIYVDNPKTKPLETGEIDNGTQNNQ